MNLRRKFTDMNIKNNKWYIYQRERFPLLFYVPAVLIVCFGTVKYACFCMKRQGMEIIPHLKLTYLFICLEIFIFYLLFRIVDEQKDYEKDKILYPERPISKGLITLKELRQLERILIVVQTAAVILFNHSLIFFHMINWVYFGLMTKEYFHPEFMKKHEYLDGVFHQFILLLLDVFAIESIGIDYEEIWNFSELSVFLLGRYTGFLALFSSIYSTKQKKSQKTEKMGLLWFVFSVFLGQSIVFKTYRGICMAEKGSVAAGIIFLILWMAGKKIGERKCKKASIRICCLWILFFSLEMGLLP